MKTWGEFMAASPQERIAWAREWIAQSEQNYHRQCQLDLEADQRAFVRGYVEEPGPIDNLYRPQSSTNRTAKP